MGLFFVNWQVVSFVAAWGKRTQRVHKKPYTPCDASTIILALDMFIYLK